MRIKRADGININSNISKNQPFSFKAMKKADFRGINFAVVEKFKAPIEKFDVLTDFQNWAGNLVEKIKNTNFLGRQAETAAQRKEMLKDWFNYVIEENGAYTKAIQLLILSAITKNLGEEDDNLPPTLNKGVLANCVSDLNNELEKDKKAQFDFNKMYQNKLRAFYSDDTKTVEIGTKWIVIPSKEHDPVNFESNVDKLKTLSHKNWCTKSYNAEPYLSEGDFHIYFENGEPKIGIRFIGNEIQEIQGELNNSTIPIQFFDKVKEYLDTNKFLLSKNTKERLNSTKSLKLEIKKIKQDLAKAIKSNDATQIYEYFGFRVKNNNGDLILSKYRQPHSNFTFKDIGIDENNLFKHVIKIEGTANFNYSNLKSLYNLKSIKGNAIFWNSQIKNLGNLEFIGQSAFFSYSKVKSLNKLKIIQGDAIFTESNIIDLGSLLSIGNAALFDQCCVSNLGNLKTIGGDIYLQNSNLKLADFKNIKIGGCVFE